MRRSATAGASNVPLQALRTLTIIPTAPVGPLQATGVGHHSVYLARPPEPAEPPLARLRRSIRMSLPKPTRALDELKLDV